MAKYLFEFDPDTGLFVPAGQQTETRAEGSTDVLERWRTEMRSDLETMKAERDAANTKRETAEQARDKALEDERQANDRITRLRRRLELAALAILLLLIIIFWQVAQRNAAEEAHRTAISAAQTQATDLQKQLGSAINENTGLRSQLATAQAQTQALAAEKAAASGQVAEIARLTAENTRLQATNARAITPTREITVSVVVSSPLRLNDLRPNNTASNGSAVIVGNNNTIYASRLVTDTVTRAEFDAVNRKVDTWTSGIVNANAELTKQTDHITALYNARDMRDLRPSSWPAFTPTTLQLMQYPDNSNVGMLRYATNDGQLRYLRFFDRSVFDADNGGEAAPGDGYYIYSFSMDDLGFITQAYLTRDASKSMLRP